MLTRADQNEVYADYYAGPGGWNGQFSLSSQVLTPFKKTVAHGVMP